MTCMFSGKRRCTAGCWPWCPAGCGATAMSSPRAGTALTGGSSWVRIGFNADPDPAFYLNADPDTRSRSMRIMILVRQKVEFLYEKYS
jgi:hypothetical protein